MTHQHKVYVVDRSLETRRLLTTYLAMAQVEAWPFDGAADFLEMADHLEPACVLLEMDAPHVSGLDIMRGLARRRIRWPVIAMSAREDLQLAVDAMKLGAVDFLLKPIPRERLVAAMVPARARLAKAVHAEEGRRQAQERLARLTTRERDVFMQLVSGRSNKAMAHRFGLSVRTVEMHRYHILAKLEVRNLAELALLATQAGLDPAAAIGEARRSGRCELPAPPSAEAAARA
jgi:two-component system, LuxR family, response regulator FixJ